MAAVSNGFHAHAGCPARPVVSFVLVFIIPTLFGLFFASRLLRERIEIALTDTLRKNAHLVRNKITQVYNLAAVLSGNAEKIPLQAWDINMRALMNTLEATIQSDAKKQDIMIPHEKRERKS